MQAFLVMFKADGTRRDFPLRKGSLVVGRKNSCELRIPLSSVSRQHCEITVAGDTISLRDLGSSNGTYHNSIRVQEARLEAGDEVVVGPVVFTLVVDGVPRDIKPVRTVLSGGSHDSGATIAATSSVEATDAEVEMAGMIDHDDDDDPLSPDATVDLDDDDDPIAALEAMARQESKKNPTPGTPKNADTTGTSKTSGVGGGGAGDSSVIEFDFDDLDDDDLK